MLTIKQITEDTDKVVRGLEKKHFANAKAAIAQAIELNDRRKKAQSQLDNNLAEVNSTSKSIGALMKEGKSAEAEAAKARVAQVKEANKALQEEMDKAAEDLQNLLYTIPNVPYDEVPEGLTAEDNVVVKMGGMETELPKNALPHWELAKNTTLSISIWASRLRAQASLYIKVRGPVCSVRSLISSLMKQRLPDILKSCLLQW